MTQTAAVTRVFIPLVIRKRNGRPRIAPPDDYVADDDNGGVRGQVTHKAHDNDRKSNKPFRNGMYSGFNQAFHEPGFFNQTDAQR